PGRFSPNWNRIRWRCASDPPPPAGGAAANPTSNRVYSTMWSRIAMQFHPGDIDGAIWRPLKKFHDPRGWLCELFRHDELPAEFHPVMAYISMTEPGVARGPHEHIDQSDCFCFLGPSNFKMYLWDARTDSPTRGARQADVVGIDKPMLVIVPPGVVHAYK